MIRKSIKLIKFLYFYKKTNNTIAPNIYLLNLNSSP